MKDPLAATDSGRPTASVASDVEGQGNTAVSFPAANVRQAIKLIEPVRVFLWAFSVFGLGLLIAPVIPDINVSRPAIAFWIVVVGCSLLGAAAAAPRRIDAPSWLYAGTRFSAAQMARRCISIGAVGVLLSVIDRYVVRGAPLSLEFFETRDIVADAGSGLISVVAAAGSSFAAFGPLVAWLARALGQPVSRSREAVAVASLIVYLFLSVALGSRSLMLVCVMVHVLGAAFLRRLQVGRLGTRAVAGVIGSLLAVTGASTWLLIERLDQMGLSPVSSIELSGYAYTLKPSPAIVDTLNGGSWLGDLGATLYSLLLYVYHGFFEFCLLFDSYRSPHLYGAQLLWLPLKVLGLISGSYYGVDPDTLVGTRSGVYTTFVGPMFLDFGWFAPLVAFWLFLLLAFPFRRVVAGDLRWLPAAVQVAAIVILAPVVSIMDSSVGTFLLLAAIALPWLARAKAS